MEEPKHLIDRAVSTQDEGLQELRDRLAKTDVPDVSDASEVSDSALDHLRDREQAKADQEERLHWRWLGAAVRNLLLWVAAIGSFILVAIDAIVRIGGNKNG